MPALRELVERSDDGVEAFRVHPGCGEALLPILRQLRLAGVRSPGAIEDVGEQLGTASAFVVTRTKVPAAAHRLPQQLLVDRPKGSGIASGGELAEDRPVEAPLRLGDEVEQVVRQEVIEARGRVHHRRGCLVALNEDAVAALTGFLKRDVHAGFLPQRRHEVAVRLQERVDELVDLP